MLRNIRNGGQDATILTLGRGSPFCSEDGGSRFPRIIDSQLQNYRRLILEVRDLQIYSFEKVMSLKLGLFPAQKKLHERLFYALSSGSYNLLLIMQEIISGVHSRSKCTPVQSR